VLVRVFETRLPKASSTPATKTCRRGPRSYFMVTDVLAFDIEIMWFSES
jgi:hypothetical protein